MFAVFETRINCERLLDMSSFKNISKKEKKKKRILQFALRVENVFFFLYGRVQMVTYGEMKEAIFYYSLCQKLLPNTNPSSCH